MRTTYLAEEWFYHHFGFKESVESVYKHLHCQKHPDRIDITSDVNNRTISAGLFSIKAPKDFPSFQAQGNGTFSIIHGLGHLDINDINICQNEDQFEGATFQVASNFNCLELASTNVTPAIGVSLYASDYTQGPAAACCCPGAVVYRNYFVEHNSGCIGQLKQQLNLLQQTPIHVVNGKTIIEDDTGLLESFDYKDENKYQVAVHENIEITTKKTSRAWEYCDSKADKRIHQVFCSTLPLCDYAIKTEKTLELTRHVLRSQYKSTILAAADLARRYSGKEGSNKLILTLLGGGYFRNPFDVIGAAINDNKQLIVDSGLDIYLNCYDDRTYQQIIPYVNNLVKTTNGKIIETE